MSGPVLSRSLLIKLALLGCVLAVVGWFVVRDLPLRAWADQTLVWVRGVGPLPFVAAMILLPAVGFPMIVFSASAGTLFSAQLGWTGVIACVGAGLAGNLALTYWLARRAFRPLLTRWVTRLGYQLPEVADEDHAGLTVLLRVTPGPPFFMQSYLLGLAEVRFAIYFWISWGIAMVYALSFTFFGDALLHGKGKAIVLGVSLLVAVSVGIRWLRRRVARKAAMAQTLDS